jgi:predicted nucleotidyltransferase
MKDPEYETELAFRVADRYLCIQEATDGHDYSILGPDYREIDGGIYDNPDISIREALVDIVRDLTSTPDCNGARGNIQPDSEFIPVDYDDLTEKMEEAERNSNAVAAFKAKTNEMFRPVGKSGPAEIEETVLCFVQAKLEEYGIDAKVVDAAVTGSRCRGLETEASDLDVVVELSTEEREDFLFDILNENGLRIGGVKVDINPITEQKTGTLVTYLPEAERYLNGLRKERAQANEILSQKKEDHSADLETEDDMER